MKTESSRSSSVGARVDRMLGASTAMAAAAAGVGVVGPTNTVDAGIVHSGPVNIAIPDNIDGVYMNLITGATGAGPVTGWDINPYSAGTANASTNFNLWGPDPGNTWLFTGTGALSQFVHPEGTLVAASQTFDRVGGTGGTIQNTAPQITLNANNYFGVQFANEGTGVNNFGWLKVTFGATLGSRAITEYAYENTGAPINIGQITAVPEPSTFALLAAGAAGLYAMRRRLKAA
jgi:hypothetical protein